VLDSGDSELVPRYTLPTVPAVAYTLFVMANLYYNDRLIIAFTSLNQSDKRWTAGAEITWRRDGVRQSHTIGGLSDRFKSSEDAERFVINLAKSWIDANP
jgi:hypothetical protein